MNIKPGDKFKSIHTGVIQTVDVIGKHYILTLYMDDGGERCARWTTSRFPDPAYLVPYKESRSARPRWAAVYEQNGEIKIMKYLYDSKGDALSSMGKIITPFHAIKIEYTEEE